MADTKLYHGTDKSNLKSILKNGLLREKGDMIYIYTSLDIDVAKKYGNTILVIDGKGLDLRVWDDELDDGQIMISGNVNPAKIKLLGE